MTAFFDRYVGVRIRDDELEKIVSLVEENPGLYDSVSHFLRASAIKEIKRIEGEKQ